MGKLLTGVLLIMGLGFTSRELWLALGEDDLDYAAIYAERRRLEQETRARRDFIEIRDATLRALGRGHITLREACAKVRQASEAHYPRYVELLLQLTPGVSVEDRLASNLAGHFPYLTIREPDLAPAIPEIERQLAEMREAMPSPANP